MTIEERRQEKFDLDIKKFESRYIPKCAKCQQDMRPNILMFGDSDWLSERVE